MIKAVIFDLDGTLSDTLSTIAHFGNLALTYCGFSSIDTEKYKYFAGNGKKVLIQRMLEYLEEYSEDNFNKVEKKYDFEYEKDVLFDTKPFDGICDLLDNLKKNGIKLAVLSNKPDNVAVAGIKQLYGDIFDVLHGKMDNIPAKPSADGVKLVLEELGVTADECIFVGDTNVDIETAKNSDILSIGVLWGFRDYNELSNAGADYIVNTPDEIFQIIFKNRE